MKGVIAGLLLGLVMVGSASAQWVNGYMRKDGTYVNGYNRTESDSNPYNNYSYPGNYNPNSGKITTGSQEEYLERYEKKSSDFNLPTIDSSYGSSQRRTKVTDIYGDSQD